jgi:hypothetical protein
LPRRNAIDVANHVWRRSADRAASRACRRTTGYAGIGRARAAQLLAAGLGRRTLLRSPAPRGDHEPGGGGGMMPHFSARNVEHFRLAALDAQRRLIRRRC